MTNNHITEYLDYYCGLDVDPQYAILIKGKWGSGKTWFINQFIEKLKIDEKKYLYVSLYGISDFKGIESEFYSQLHPVLSHKGMEIASKLAKSVIKATIKYDMNDDGRSDGSVDISLQNMPSYLVNTNDRLLIFDDVERCSIPISDLLGYVNNFVEHKSYRAILIANEEEIGVSQHDDPESSKYARIKEKLIGKSFEIEPDFDNAVDSFFNEIKDTSALNALQKNRYLVKTIFDQAKFNNFRHLRQSFLEMERVFKAFPTKAFGNKELIQHFIRFYLIYSLEIRSGNSKARDIVKANPNPKYLFDRRPENIGVHETLAQKYNINLYDTLFTAQLWLEMLDAGVIDKGRISNEINTSKYFLENDTPEWLILWHCGSLADSKIDHYLTIMRKKFDNKEYDDAGVICHVTALLIWFSKIGVISKRSNSIIKEAVKYINYLYKQGKIPNNLANLLANHSYRSFGFYEAEDPEFLEFLSFVKQKSQQVKLDQLPEKGKELLELLKSNPEEFSIKIQSNNGIFDFRSYPILNYISKAEFVDVFSNLTNDKRVSVRDCLIGRYATHHDRVSLKDEKLWIDGVVQLLTRKAKKNPRTLTSYFILKMRDELSKISSSFV